MADPHIKSLLERKCIEIEARIDDNRRLLTEAQTDLVHLSATIAMFGRDTSKRDAEPVMSLASVFKRGELFHHCEIALEKHPGGLDTRELSRACLMAKGLDPDDRALHRRMIELARFV